MRQGVVPITVGRNDGEISITSPLFYWKIVSGRLRITTDGHSLYKELTLISRDSTTIVVRSREGKIATYKILK